MKYPCNVIRDLLPLYHDEVCSKESAIMIQEHMNECPDCIEYDRKFVEYTTYTPQEQNLEKEKARFLQNIKRKITQKKIIASVVSIH